MSRELLKTSLRHTHAYIDAYGEDLLQEVELLFRRALEQAAGEDDLDEDDEESDLSVSFDAPATPAVTAAAPFASSAATVVSAQEQDQASPEHRLVPVANWHFYLPALVAAVAVAVFLLRGWLS